MTNIEVFLEINCIIIVPILSDLIRDLYCIIIHHCIEHLRGICKVMKQIIILRFYLANTFKSKIEDWDEWNGTQVDMMLDEMVMMLFLGRVKYLNP